MRFKIMVTFLIFAALRGAMLIRSRRLLEGSTYFDVSVNGTALILGPETIRGNTVSNSWRILEMILINCEINLC